MNLDNKFNIIEKSSFILTVFFICILAFFRAKSWGQGNVFVLKDTNGKPVEISLDKMENIIDLTINDPRLLINLILDMQYPGLKFDESFTTIDRWEIRIILVNVNNFLDEVKVTLSINNEEGEPKLGALIFGNDIRKGSYDATTVATYILRYLQSREYKINDIKVDVVDKVQRREYRDSAYQLFELFTILPSIAYVSQLADHNVSIFQPRNQDFVFISKQERLVIEQELGKEFTFQRMDFEAEYVMGVFLRIDNYFNKEGRHYFILYKEGDINAAKEIVKEGDAAYQIIMNLVDYNLI